MKFSGKVGNGPLANRLNFGGDPDYRLGLGIVFPGFDTIGRSRKLDGAAVMTSLRHRPTTARERLRCTQRAVSLAHDIARLV